MAVQKISQSQFDKNNPPRTQPADNHMSREIEWYEDKDANTIGLIALDKTDEA